jgi:hypothetical protein
MKKILTVIGTIVSFFGLASFTLFMIMSPPGIPNPATPSSRTGLAADIGGIISGDGSAGDVAATEADANTVATGDVNAGDTAAANTASDGTVITPATTGQTTTTDITTPLAPNVTTSITSVAAPTVIVPALPEATATVTVTPTAPPPPPAHSAPTVQSQTSAASATTPALPYGESNFASDTNWKTTWGTAGTTSAGSLRLAAAANSVGGAVYLENATGWTNYTMHTTLDLLGGTTFGLMANYIDASNYVLCEYTAATSTIAIQLSQFTDGYETALTPNVDVPWDGNGSDLNASIKVGGLYGTCSLNGQTVSNEGIGAGKSAMSQTGNGSIGFTVNDAAPGTSEITVGQVSVTGN